MEWWIPEKQGEGNNMRIAFVVGSLHMEAWKDCNQCSEFTFNRIWYRFNVLNNNNFYKIDKKVNVIEGNIQYLFLIY